LLLHGFVSGHSEKRDTFGGGIPSMYQTYDEGWHWMWNVPL